MQSINHPAQPASRPGLGRALRFQVQVEVVPSAAQAPAAACQPGDGALVALCPAEPGVPVTRAAGRHPSVNQRTGGTRDLHRGRGAGPLGVVPNPSRFTWAAPLRPAPGARRRAEVPPSAHSPALQTQALFNKSDQLNCSRGSSNYICPGGRERGRVVSEGGRGDRGSD